MDKQTVLAQTQDIFRDLLDDETVVLADETTAKDVDGWDSLTHLQLIVAIEKHFKIKFVSKEILSWKNVGEMLDCIVARLAKNA
jgi:acyl carrier protein